MGQTGSAPLVSYPAPKTRAIGAGSRCRELPTPQCLVLTDTALSCPALPTPPLPSSSQFTRSTRPKSPKPLAQPSPANIPGAQSGTHRRRSLRKRTAGQERALKEGKQPWNRGARREPELSRVGTRKAVCPEVHESHSHMNQTPEEPWREPMWPPEQPLRKEQQCRASGSLARSRSSLQPCRAAHSSQTACSRAGCWLIPASLTGNVMIKISCHCPNVIIPSVWSVVCQPLQGKRKPRRLMRRGVRCNCVE